MRSRTGGRLDPHVAEPRRGDDQRDDREGGDDEVERRAPRAEPGHGHVAVQVADEEHALEEEQDRRPDRRRPAEDGEHEPADQGLDTEQEEGRQPDRQRERERFTEQRAGKRGGTGSHGVSGRVSGSHRRPACLVVK